MDEDGQPHSKRDPWGPPKIRNENFHIRTYVPKIAGAHKSQIDQIFMKFKEEKDIPPQS